MTFTKVIATQLVEVAKRVGSPLEASYRNAIYCNCTLDQEGGVITGQYCGTRWCLTCNRIRTAKAHDRYMPVLLSWADAHVVTLTKRNMGATKLKSDVDRMFKGFTAAKRGIKETDRLPFEALRKLECTYNAATDEYHPHFHVLVKGRAAADRLVNRWLALFPDETTPEAQDVRPADQESLQELFKYFTKLISKGSLIPAVALDVIFRAMHGHRVYQPIGFVLPKDDADDDGELELDHGTEAITRPGESIVWEWDQRATDWVDRNTGECLTGYEPTARFRQLLERVEHPPSAERIRTLAPVEPFNLHAVRDVIRRRLAGAAREPIEADFVSQTLQRVYALSAKRARDLAARLLAPNEPQITLFS